MTEDGALLLLYVTERSEAAFGEVVDRHINLVYFAALRQLGGDVHLARDVTQVVFAELAAAARALARHRSLAGWLYLTARNQSAKLVRSEVRRRKREEQAQSMIDSEAPLEWDRVAPVIDQALCQLNAREREAVLLRLLENRAFAEIARIQATTEAAARMRVNRSLERLRAILSRSGIASTAAAIEAALQTQAIASCPASLSAQVASTATAAAATQGAASGITLLMNAATTKIVGTGAIAMILLALWTSDASTTQRLESRLADEERTVEALRHLAVRGAPDASENAATAATTSTQSMRPIVDATSNSNSILGQIPAGTARATIQISSDGAPSWEGTRVTLNELIQNLVAYRKAHPEADAQLLINSNGAIPSQLAYLFDQAQRAGIENVWFDPSTRSPLSDPPLPARHGHKNDNP